VRGTPWISHEAAVAAKIAIALATAALVAWGAWLDRRGRGAVRRRARDCALAVLGLAGASGWWWFGASPIWNDVHVHDSFHYYLGAKYFRELGYSHLYLCALGADLEAGLDPGPRIRDLATNDLVPAHTQLAAARACQQRFTAERWSAFRADLDWLRARVSKRAWQQIREDHGFNGSPVWLAGGALLAATPGGAAALPWLVRVDLLLFAALWIGALWGFGWRTTAVAAVFWGTNGLEGWDWTGATLLRQDWLAALVVGLACLRRERPVAAGFLLAWSAGLRVFPALAIAGLVAKRALDAVRARSLAPLRGLARLAAGIALAVALFLPLSVAVAGRSAWPDFVANSRKLVATPLFNHVGLRPLLAFEAGAAARDLEQPAAAEPNAAWKASQRARYAETRWVFATLVAAWALLLARVLARQSDWSAAALAIGGVPVLFSLTGYYLAALVALALLHARAASAGVAMALCAAATQASYASLPYSDVPFLGMSAICLAAVLFVTMTSSTRQFTARLGAEASRRSAGGPKSLRPERVRSAKQRTKNRSSFPP
jgi:hypothetical protein